MNMKVKPYQNIKIQVEDNSELNELKNKFIKGLEQSKPQILKSELIADIETPISCLLKLKKNQPC